MTIPALVLAINCYPAAEETQVTSSDGFIRWFLGMINGPTARKLQVPLSFLGQGDYQAALIRDHKDDPAAVQLENTTARRGDLLAIELGNGGGFIARFSKN
jgi:alpha-glucosidase